MGQITRQMVEAQSFLCHNGIPTNRDFSWFFYVKTFFYLWYHLLLTPICHQFVISRLL